MAHPPASPDFVPLAGGITAPRGFRAAGVHCGLKANGDRDLALIVSERPATAAGVFTRNRVQAAPVRYTRERLVSGHARAIVVNAGNANACTGRQGDADTVTTAELTAEALSLPVEEVLVASTGVIGVPLPMERLRIGIPAVAAALEESGEAAAAAIMTTDTVPKTAAVELVVGDATVRIGGMAKGAGMIRPDMATTLAFLTTDAAVDADTLKRALAAAIDTSFNCITVDGDTSTNDCVLVLANGGSGVEIDAGDSGAVERFTAALTHVATDLAKQVVRDGEGATKLIQVTVEGASCEPEARQAAFAVAESLLVKTALHGGEPNWGRILSAVGSAGVEIEEERIAVWFNQLQVAANGRAVSTDLEAAAQELRQTEIELRVSLGSGSGRAVVWTCDLSAEYVHINGSYIS